MIAGLDSSFDRPTPAIAAQAYAAGIRLWGGYVGTQGGLGLATLWSKADFDVVRNAGMTAIGFCSGWDDPIAVSDLAAAWGVLLCVDVEFGIRNDGPWIPSWLAASGAGLYGNASVHFETGQPIGRGAAFNIVSGYFGYDPQATWESWLDDLGERPNAPCGWQWEGGHSEFGLDVDRAWFDDWFGSAHTGGTVFSQVPSQGGDAMSLLSTPGGRLDFIHVGTDGNVYHRWKNALLDDLAVQNEGWGSPGVPLVRCEAAYDDGGAVITVLGTAADGSVWACQRNLSDGSVHNAWFALDPANFRVLVPEKPGPAVFVPHKHSTDGGTAV